jgi:gluconolactonase
MRSRGLVIFFGLLVFGCAMKKKGTEMVDNFEKIGKVIKYDDALDKLVQSNSQGEILGSGYKWSEGPLELEGIGVIFSDVPNNIIHLWSPKSGMSTYLQPSGYTSSIPRGGETGSNGLTLNPQGKLVLCQHGDRRMAMMDADLKNPQPKYINLADKFEGKRFSSPNDACYNDKGDLFFTDPPYGLEKQANDPAKEISFQGVYKVSKDGKVTLMVDSLTRPNGIAFMPDGKSVIVANSDPSLPNWYIFDYDGEKFMNGRIFYSAKGHDKSMRGLPDGFKIDKSGNVFATGPGGVYIFDKTGKKLGLLSLSDPTSNCALSKDQKTLYITNNNKFLRWKLR